MVLLHGLRMDATPWDEVTAALSPGHRCVAPTLPLGTHRRAMMAGADLSLPRIAKLVAEFLDRFGLDDVTLVGNDTGGAVDQLLAADGAPRVGRVMLASCDAFDNFPPGLTGPGAGQSCRRRECQPHSRRAPRMATRRSSSAASARGRPNGGLRPFPGRACVPGRPRRAGTTRRARTDEQRPGRAARKEQSRITRDYPFVGRLRPRGDGECRLCADDTAESVRRPCAAHEHDPCLRRWRGRIGSATLEETGLTEPARTSQGRGPHTGSAA